MSNNQVHAIDLEIGDWLVIDGDTARRITGLEVHTNDGEIRITMGSLKLVYHTAKLVQVLA